MRIRIGRRATAAAACALAAGLAVPLAAAAQPNVSALATVNVYVSPGGNDQSGGLNAAQPLRTLAQAQQVVRGLTHSSVNVTVNLAGGVYRLTAPLDFTAADSPTAPGAHITWQAAPGATTVVSGGASVTGWAVSDKTRNIWAAPAPAQLTDSRQLYVNGVRAARASGVLPVTVTQTSTGYTTASGDPMASWRNPSHIEFVYTGGLGAWTEPRCPVASITSTTITMAQPCWNNSTKRVMRTDGSGRTVELVGRQSITEAPTSVENAYELLTKPGQWYLDTAKRTIYYIPRSGENLATADVQVPVMTTLLSAKGTAGAPVHDLSFQGIEYEYATETTADTGTGFSEIQATDTITGTTGYATQGLCTFVKGGTCPYGNWTKMVANVALAYDQNVTFTGDYFVHLGGAGLDLGDGTQNATVVGCVFTDISGNGLDVGGTDINEPSAAQATTGVTIHDSHFYNTSDEYHGGVAIFVGYVQNSTFRNNQIDHVPYTGISVGWGGWPDKVKLPAEPNASHGNLFSDNLIFNHMSYLGDGGAIYTNGITGSTLANGEHITGNLIHDQISTKGHGIYTDNGSSYITITGNAEYNIAANVWGSKHVNYTLNNGTYDPLDIQHNYWTNGPAPYNAKAVLIANNTNITSPSQIPASIVSAAGIQPPYTSILSWRPGP